MSFAIRASGLLLGCCCVIPFSVLAAEGAPPGLSAGEWRDVREQIDASRFAIATPAAQPSRRVASNPRQQAQMVFGPEGLELTPVTGGWTLALRTRSIARAAGARHELPATAPASAANRVTYAHPELALEEWYVNAPAGLEHGYTLGRRPAGSGTVRIEIAARGLTARALDTGALEFLAGAEPVLSYAKLLVTDAAGATLPATLGTSADGRLIRIAFDDRDARYPVTVDPLIELHDAKLEPTDDGYSAHDFGQSVALSGDTLLVGDPAVATHGAAYVFVRQGDGWTLEQRLTAADGSDGDDFGRVVALDGDTAVIGMPADMVRIGAITFIPDTGSAYVFTRSAGVWTQQQKLALDNADAFDRFGAAVAVSGDTLLVGAPEAGTFDEGAAFVYVRSAGAWALQQQLVASTAYSYNELGTAVALDGDTAVVTRLHGDVAGADFGGAYVFVRSGGTWSEQQELTGMGVPEGSFGAAAALSGDTLLVGAPLDDAFGADAGAAYVYLRSGGSWSLEQSLAWGNEEGQQFGRAVALSGDVAVVGAPLGDTADGVDAGTAQVFRRSGGVWTAAVLPSSGTEASDQYGHAVAVDGTLIAVAAALLDQSTGDDSGGLFTFALGEAGPAALTQVIAPHEFTAGDQFGTVAVSGDTLIVGAYLDSTARGQESGAAYAFVRSGDSWNLQQKLTASDGAAGDWFGFAVDVSGDTALIGAMADDAAAPDAGAAYVFVRSGGVWTEQQKLVPADGKETDNFGTDVALSGNTALVGALAATGPDAQFQGAAYAYVREAGAWSLQQKLVSPAGADFDFFGGGVAVDGDRALVSAYRDSTSVARAGAVYAFARFDGTWFHTQQLVAPDAGVNDRFGRSVVLSGDTAVIGAYLDDTDAGVDAGSAYVFTYADGWSLQQKLTASDGAAGDLFGRMVAIAGDAALIAAYQHDTAAGADAGAAYLFTRAGGTWTEQQKFVASDGAADDLFGIHVALSADAAFIGAANHDTALGADAGAVYAWYLSASTPDTTPDPFTFVERTGVATSVFITSEAKTLAGFDGSLAVTVTNGQYSIDGGPYTTAAGTITAGQTLRVRHVSASSASTPTVTQVAVGSYATEFRSVTSSIDRTPDAFTFGTKTGVVAGALVESGVVTLTGFNTGIAIVPGPGIAYRIGSGSYTTAQGTLAPGQTLQVRHTASSTSLGYTKTYLKVGGVVGYFTTRTQ